MGTSVKNPKLSGTTHNVFGIQVGVSINLFIKKSQVEADPNPTKIFYARVDEFWKKEEKYNYLDSKQHYQNIDWQQLTPDSRYTWLTEGLHPEFDNFIPMGNKTAKKKEVVGFNTIYHTFGIGLQTSRDAWVYNFNENTLIQNVKRMSDLYNTQVMRWKGIPQNLRTELSL